MIGTMGLQSLPIYALLLCFQARPSTQQQFVFPADTTPPTPGLPPTRDQGYVNLTSGVDIYYYHFGASLDDCKSSGNIPLFFLHGGLANSHYWGHQIDFLLKSWAAAEHTAIFAIDTRAQGRSTGINMTLSYDLFTQDLMGVLDHFDIPKVSIVGWSDGAIIGYDLAINQPARLDRLFGFAGSYSYTNSNRSQGDPNVVTTFVERSAVEYKELSPTPNDFLELFHNIEALYAVAPNYTAADFAKIPTLFDDCKTAPFIWVVDAADEDLVGRTVATTIHNWINGSGKAILPSVSHYAFLQDPLTFNAYLARFLDFSVNCTSFLRRPDSGFYFDSHL